MPIEHGMLCIMVCDMQHTRISRKQLVSFVGLLTKTSIAMARSGSMPYSRTFE
jgi:hypothetical protein